MNIMLTNIIMLIQVLSALVIIGLVLVQHGKGADMGAAFGSGASGSLFGATGSSNFLSKSTGIAAAIFFTATLALTYLGNTRHSALSGGVLDSLPSSNVPAAPSASAAAAPAAPAPAAAAQQPVKPASAPAPANQIPK